MSVSPAQEDAMEGTHSEDTGRAARLQALREDLDRRLDELRTMGGSDLARIQKEFDRAWKELNELVGGSETIH
jgi:hypothetical protein